MRARVAQLALAVFLGLAVGPVLAFFSGCAPVPVTPVRPAACTEACAKGAELGCVWATPTPNGATCTDVCESANRILPWRTECLWGARTCEEADACN